jgi:ABC-2 type transport system permease protein
MTTLIADTHTVFARELRPALRNPATIIISMVQPLVFLALFAPLLPGNDDGSALQWFVPGIVVMSCLFVVVCVPFGFDVHVGGALLGVLILAGFCIGLGALSYTLALASQHQEWMFWTVQQTLLFPLLLLAGVLLPIDGGPGWLRTLSAGNPLTYVVQAERALFNGDVWSSATATGLLSAAGVAAFGLLVGVRAMRRSE